MMTAEIKQACRRRRQLLALVEAFKASGPAKGKWLAETAGIEDFDEAYGLLMDLVNLGMLEALDMRTSKYQTAGLLFTHYRITAKGTRLLAGLEPVEPLIEDERI